MVGRAKAEAVQEVGKSSPRKRLVRGRSKTACSPPARFSLLLPIFSFPPCSVPR